MGCKPEIVWVDADAIEADPKSLPKVMKGVQAIVVPGGFGTRGVEGKILAINYARVAKIPFLGLCYGLQLAVVEFSRNVLKLKQAHTTEIDKKTPHPVIHLMNEQEEKMKNKDYGGTMRLGEFPCVLKTRTIARSLYGRELVMERHRHRYECNPEYREKLEAAGLIHSGLSPDGKLAEIVELKGHPYFVATQAHPEFRSRPMEPHPLFYGLIVSAYKKGSRYL